MHKAENSLEYLHEHTCNYQWTTQPIFIFPVYNSVLSLPLCVYTNTVKCRLRSRADSLFWLPRTHTCFLPIGEFEHVCTRIQEIHLSLYSMISLISSTDLCRLLLWDFIILVDQKSCQTTVLINCFSLTSLKRNCTNVQSVLKRSPVH